MLWVLEVAPSLFHFEMVGLASSCSLPRMHPSLHPLEGQSAVDAPREAYSFSPQVYF